MAVSANQATMHQATNQQSPVQNMAQNIQQATMVPPVFSNTAFASTTPKQAAPAVETNELARARAIAQRLGITNLTDDEYEIPTYLRRQQDKESQL